MADTATYPYSVQDAQNASNPLYIHPNESPSTVLVSPSLIDENYHSWSRAMKMSLLTKNKLGFVDGTIVEPAKENAVFPFWERGNMLVLSWLIKSMSVEIAQSILWREKASDVWKELHERFSHADLFRILEIQEKIFSQRQGDNSVSKFYTALKILWDELDVLNPLPVCTCNPKCSCGAIKKIEEERNKNQVVRFFRGLNDQYSGVRSQLMLLDNCPNVNRVFALVAQQERQFATENASMPKALIVASDDASHSKRNQGNGNGWNNRYTSKKCSWCEKMGHTIDVCYRKHGFPSSFKFKNSKNIVPRSANMLMTEENETNCPEDSSGKDTQESVRFGFTTNQYQNLLALLPQQDQRDSTQHTAHVKAFTNSNPTSNGNALISRWILDTGATDHISNSLSYFTAYKNIPPIKVSLPNGILVSATISGTIHLSSSFVLTDDSNACKMIGTAKAERGLYIFTQTSYRTKFDPRATRCIFLGYKSGTKGYIVYDIKTRELSVSRNVVFHENIFPYQLKSPTNTTSNSSIPLPTFIPTEPFDYTQPQTESEPEIPQNPLLDSEIAETVTTPHNPIPTPQCSTKRIIKPPSYLQDYHYNLVAATAVPHQSSSKGNLYPLSQVLSYDCLTPSYQSFILNITTTPEPTRYSKAVKHECWRIAMDQELEALARNNTSVLVDKPPDKNLIGCKWVYKVKHKQDGTVERHKARLVVKGYTQIEGIDFMDTFSP
ncbi:uncharacterized protein LOC109819099 [Cajanus cajan]|uniref:uncharacterized protein LOC109819099 n=1 Tax=Cajanus cajan TaxID=3821 RepID=UPI00098DCB1B|nr:uncharacterized protein LOC109819099 [Cajanus cajan]